MPSCRHIHEESVHNHEEAKATDLPQMRTPHISSLAQDWRGGENHPLMQQMRLGDFIRDGGQAMKATCLFCEHEKEDCESHPELVCPDDPYEPESPICLDCIDRARQQAEMDFVCNECFGCVKGNRISMTAFGMFCNECMSKEGFEVPTLTPIPENGWSGKDVGRVVFIKGEHGVIIKDTIVMSSLRGPDIVIGPSTYVSALHNRMLGFVRMSSSNTYDEGLRALLDELHGDDDDEEGGIPL